MVESSQPPAYATWVVPFRAVPTHVVHEVHDDGTSIDIYYTGSVFSVQITDASGTREVMIPINLLLSIMALHGSEPGS